MSTAKRAADGDRFLGGGGEMGALMRAFDWSGTTLGPVSSWPQSLKTSVSICLNSRFPMILWWGPELTVLYNDPYIPALGHKHPHLALGKPGKEVWAEIWDVIEPLLHRVLQEGDANWAEDLQLFINRKGYLEECYFTFSYSPIRDEAGDIAGVFTPVAETTAKVIGERRLRTLHELAGAMNQVRAESEVFPAAAAICKRNPYDLPLATLYSLSPDGSVAELRASCGVAAGEPLAPRSISLDDAASPLAGAFRRAMPAEIPGAEAFAGTVPRGPWEAPVASAFAVPLLTPGLKAPAGFLVSGVNPRKLLDEDYRSFLDLVAGQIAGGLAAARAVEEERRRSEALQELDRAKTAFFSNISHEFRTPLTLMLGPLQQLLAQPDEAIERYRPDLDLVHRNSQRLLKLVNNLLNFSRIEAGRARARYAPIDLAAFTADLASVFRSAIERAGLRLHIDCPPLAEPVYADPDLWEDAVLNLISNAFKFTFNGSVTIRLRTVGRNAELSVEDTGIGIAADELPRIFERFHRIEGSRGRTHEGSGIGLALVRDIARLHGGDVRAVSEPGRGSVFTLAIPLGKAHLPAGSIAEGAAAPANRAAAAYVQEMVHWTPAASPATGSAAPAASPRARILLADDNADMRAYVARLLRDQYEVEAVTDGAEALAAIRRNPPDLILSDVMMPHIDGAELLRQIRADAELRGTPVILLSARAGQEARVEGLNTGADDYLTKPFSARELLARVAAHLAISQLRREAAGRERELRLDVDTERRRWRQIVEQAPAVMALLRGPDHVFEVVNTQYARATGRTPEQLLGKPLCEALPEFKDQVYAGLLDRVYASGEPYAGYGMPVRINRQGTGALEDRFFTFVFQPFRGPAGAVEGVLVHAVDDTDRVLAQRQLEERAAELGAIMDAVPAAIFIAHDPECQNITGNRSSYELTRIPPGDNLAPGGRAEPLPFVVTRDGKPLDPVNGPLRRAAASGQSVRDFDFSIEFADGSVRHMFGHAVPLFAKEGDPRGAVASFIDITEARRNEERLRRSQKLESVGLLAGGVAHDFNNLLVGILGNASLAYDLVPPASELAVLLGDIETAGQRAATLVRQMLVYAGKAQFATESISLSALCRETVKLLQAAIAKQIELAFDLDPDLPHVQAAAGEMQQVMMNLVLNAAEAIGDGPGMITMRTAVVRLDTAAAERLAAAATERLAADHSLTPGSYVALEVSDTGCGMDEQTRSRIFDPFFTTKFLGRGLGLAAVSGIIRGHKGAIQVASAPESGSTFKILLPITAQPEPVVEESPHSQGEAEAARCDGVILVVDDEELVLRAVRAILENRGYTVHAAMSGRDAVRIYKENAAGIDAVLLDVSMPGMSGPETLMELRAVNPGVAVLVASGHAEPQARGMFHGQTLDGFVSKPFSARNLVEQLVRVTGAGKSAL